MSYGISIPDLFRQAAVYVNRVIGCASAVLVQNRLD